MTNKKGFNLIEIIVVLGIISLFFGFSLFFYKKNSLNDFVKNDAYLLKTHILKAKNMSKNNFSSVDFSENNNYGIYLSINNSNYYLYKDLNNNNSFDDNEIIETFILENSYISSLLSGPKMDILFNLNGDVFLNSFITKLENINIYLTSIKNDTDSISIVINSLIWKINIQ